MIRRKPHTIVITDVVDHPVGPEDDDSTLSLACQVTPMNVTEALRQTGVAYEKAFMVLCDNHATTHNVPKGGSFPIRDGQKVTWGGRTFITRGAPEEFRLGSGADHLKFVMEETYGG